MSIWPTWRRSKCYSAGSAPLAECPASTGATVSVVSRSSVSVQRHPARIDLPVEGAARNDVLQLEDRVGLAERAIRRAVALFRGTSQCSRTTPCGARCDHTRCKGGRRRHPRRSRAAASCWRCRSGNTGLHSYRGPGCRRSLRRCTGVHRYERKWRGNDDDEVFATDGAPFEQMRPAAFAGSCLVVRGRPAQLSGRVSAPKAWPVRILPGIHRPPALPRQLVILGRARRSLETADARAGDGPAAY
jgi:hypothetical protein